MLRRVRPCLTAVLVAALAAPVAAQTSGSWNVNPSGNYGTAANWAGGVPNAGGVATFGTGYGQTAAVTVTTDINPTLSGLTFDSPFGYTLNATNPITTTGTFTINAVSSNSTSLSSGNSNSL